MTFGFDARTRELLQALRQEGSFSAAARALGLDASNARRHVRTAERRAGVRLVEARAGGRGGWNAQLTAAGRRRLGASGIPARVLGYDAIEGVSRVQVGSRVLAIAGRYHEGAAHLTIPPESVALEKPREMQAEARGSRRSQRNAIPMRVASLREDRPGVWRVELASGALKLASLVTAGAVRDLRLRKGTKVIAVIKATAISLA